MGNSICARAVSAVLLAWALVAGPAYATSTVTRTTSYTYDSATGLLKSETVEPGASDASQTIETDYTYDDYGNKTAVTVKGCVWTSTTVCSATSRTTSTTYDTNGQFPVTVTNAVGKSEIWEHDAASGQPTSHTGPNGLKTVWTYDGFGRKILETRPDHNKTSWDYLLWTSSAWPEIHFYVRQMSFAEDGVTKNGPVFDVSYDELSRAVLKQVQAFNGTDWINTYQQYDTLGRLARTSRPYIESGPTEPEGPAEFTTYAYDLLGRVTQATFPDGSHTTYTYQGLTSSVTNDKGQTTITAKNAQGLTAVVTDPAGHATFYAYDGSGNTAAITDPDNNITLNTYDTRGRKIASTDPDMGHWTYKYDSWGELAAQTDANGQATTLAYDALGRMTQRAEANFVSNWVYDTAPHGVGQLASACTGSGCTSPSDSDYFRSQTYDSYGRPSGVALTIGGTTYNYAATYDANGRLDTLSYPSGFVAKYIYTSQGYLSQISDNANSAALWTVNSRDAEMHALQSTAGNGVITGQVFDPETGRLEQVTAGTSGHLTSLGTWSYSFDTLGNLTSRSDTFEVYNEAFCYDNLNRLTSYAVGASCTATGKKTVGYDVLGNITSKSDVGTYIYAGSAPHALSSVAGIVNGVTDPTYSYDGNGNLLSGAGRTITYTAFNMADTITQGTTSDVFTYDSEHARSSSTLTGVGTTTYLNALGGKSEKLVSGSDTTWHDYIEADGQIVAEKFSGATSATDYFVLDNLGSIALMTDASGAAAERDSYDAWGKRRNPNSSDATAPLTSVSTRGFTNQEEIDAFGLVNMNARIYDPMLGRFMTADPSDGSGLNRYWYVGNNPLSLTDPTGLCFLGCFWKSPIGRDLIGIAVGILLQQEWALPSLLGSLGVGATTSTYAAVGIAGGASGAITTGKASGALIGSLEAISFFQVGNALAAEAANSTNVLGSQIADKIISHGLVGGIASVAGGGKFGSGFLAAGIGSLAPAPNNEGLARAAEGATEGAILGGFGSVLGGGKFQNGAITGAFGYLFNSLAHAWAGSEATRALGRTLNDRDGPGSWIVDKGSIWDILFIGRADLVNTANSSVFEIKTNYCLSNFRCTEDAEEQLREYIDSGEGRLSEGSPYTAFRGLPKLYGYGTVQDVDLEFVYSSHGGGLIGYDITNAESHLYNILKNWSFGKQPKSTNFSPMSLLWDWAIP